MKIHERYVQSVAMQKRREGKPDIVDILHLQITKHGIIGKGSFGVTYDGEFKGSKVAIKSVEVRDEIEGKNFLRELDTLTRARHANIMAFFGESRDSA